MREIAKFEKDLGSDAKLSASVGVSAEHLEVTVSAKYPLEKVLAPITKLGDDLLTKLEQIIPGDWDVPAIEKAKMEFKEALYKIVGGKSPAALSAPEAAE